MLAERAESAALTGILAEGSLQDATFAATVSALREQGERVVLALPGADNDPAELGCQCRLVAQADGWVVTDL
jgi:ATP phosphoribosyltransferase regulatory subunit